MLSAEHEKPARANTLMRLARYYELERGVSEARDIGQLMEEAKRLQPEREKFHYWHGRLADRVLARERLAEQDKWRGDVEELVAGEALRLGNFVRGLRLPRVAS